MVPIVAAVAVNAVTVLLAVAVGEDAVMARLALVAKKFLRRDYFETGRYFKNLPA